MKALNLFMLCLVILLSPPLLHAEEIDKHEGCDSCLFKINSLEKPYDLTGQWLFSRKDSEQNKAVNLDTSDWELIKAPGPWMWVELGKTFTVGWYRGVFEFPPELIGQKAVVFMDTYLSRTDIYLDGNLIFRRPDPGTFPVILSHTVHSCRVYDQQNTACLHLQNSGLHDDRALSIAPENPKI